MTCLTSHEHVIASGRCADCGLPVQLTVSEPWLAVPFGADSSVCRVTGDLHVVDHAVGACCGCSAVLEAVGTDDRGLVWLET